MIWNSVGIHEKLKIALTSETIIQKLSIKAPQSVLPLKTYTANPGPEIVLSDRSLVILFSTISTDGFIKSCISDGTGGTSSTVVLLPKLVLCYSGHDLGFRVNCRSD
jgi:hypothetical protein